MPPFPAQHVPKARHEECIETRVVQAPVSMWARAPFLLALALAVVAACDANVEESAEVDAGDAEPECPTDCDAPCPEGSDCLKVGQFQVLLYPACAKLCTATEQCAPGEKCLEPLQYGFGNAYCVSDANPVACGKPWGGHCDFFGWAECRDAHTLAKGTDKLGVFCGYELVNCPNGCSATSADGGSTKAACLP